jgi:hypothetical protein
MAWFIFCVFPCTQTFDFFSKSKGQVTSHMTCHVPSHVMSHRISHVMGQVIDHMMADSCITRRANRCQVIHWTDHLTYSQVMWEWATFRCHSHIGLPQKISLLAYHLFPQLVASWSSVTFRSWSLASTPSSHRCKLPYMDNYSCNLHTAFSLPGVWTLTHLYSYNHSEMCIVGFSYLMHEIRR